MEGNFDRLRMCPKVDHVYCGGGAVEGIGGTGVKPIPPNEIYEALVGNVCIGRDGRDSIRPKGIVTLDIENKDINRHLRVEELSRTV